MTMPDGIPELIAAGVQQASQQSQRLGVSWTLRQGTVTATRKSEVEVILDGESVGDARSVIKPIPLAGLPSAGARVMVLLIPDASFILSIVGAQTSSQIIDDVLQRSNSDLTLTTSFQTVPGTEITVTGSGRWYAACTMDFAITTASSAIGLGELVMESGSESARPLGGLTSSTGRITTFQQWSGTFSSSGIHYFGLAAAKTAALGVISVMSDHTCLRVVTYN